MIGSGSLMDTILGSLRGGTGQRPGSPPSHRTDTADELRIVAEDTISRTPNIIATTQGASAHSIFHSKQLPPLDKGDCPNLPQFAVRVIRLDALTTARNSIQKDPTIRGKVALLNLAGSQCRAGGWRSAPRRAQEDALCYSSTLYITLKEEYYPWPNLGPGSDAGIYSPAVVVFKDNLDHSCIDLPVDQRETIAVLTIAAPRLPKVSDGRLSNDSDLRDLRRKIRLVYRMAGHNGKQVLVLGAMGCGTYGCPPRQVAEEMRAILFEEEFVGWFKEVDFAINSARRTGPTNYDIFKDIFEASES